jgi:myotubularin-related protein 6/7/8
MVGLTNNRSIQDEKLVESIFQSHLSVDSALTSPPESRARNRGVYGATATNLIIDARPTANAMVNASNGGGTENMDNYKNAKKAYLGVANIHTMRDSLNKVVEALRDADIIAEHTDGASTTGLVDREALRRSNWLRHISAILEGTLLIVRNVHVNSSHVLIHCSDGWDRTSQMSALAQLCLDPYYRTIRGFQVLIEKDWLSFGHKFLDRCGHLSSERVFQYGSGDESGQQAQAFLTSVQNRLTGPSHLKEISPVFHQFLESVRQIQRQSPERFEFNERFLERIHFHLYSCQFGTFLFNCERERRISLDGASRWSGMEKTHSAWERFNMAENKEKWVNPSYDPALDDPKKGDMGVLMPNPKDVRFWNELYGRTDEEMNGKLVTGQATGADVVAVEDLDGDAVLAATVDAMALEVPPLQSKRTALRTTSPSVPSTSQSRQSTPPIVRTSPNLPARPAPQQARVESFRAYNTPSAFSLHSSSATPSPTPSLPGPSNLPHVGNALSGNSNPSIVSNWNTPSTPSAPQQGAFGFGALRAGLSSAGVQSVWGKLSANASAAFVAVQDTAKDFQERYNQSGGAENGELGERVSAPSSNKSALGWPTDDPGWGTSTTHPAIPAASNASHGGPSATLPSTMRDPYTANPWTAAAETSNPQQRRQLEDEWRPSPASRGRLSQTSQVSGPTMPLSQPSGAVLAPTPRRASAYPVSLASEAPVVPEPVKPPDGATTTGAQSASDPLGVGLL